MTTTSNESASPGAPSNGLYARIAALSRRRATWVLIDQAVVSAGNFLTGTLLARHLVQAQFGAYQVLLDTILYLNSLQSALVIYPLTIKGATGDRSNLGRLATASLLLTLALLPILGGATVLSVAALHNWQIMISAVAALLLWQLQETLRRALISDLRFADAVWGDAISYLGQAALIFVLAHFARLDLNQGFIVMAATSAAAMVVQALQIGLKPIRPWQLKSIVKDFWRLGRWMLIGNAAGVISYVGYSWTLLWSHGTNANAVWGAIIQLFKLANPVISSMSSLITPAVARVAHSQSSKAAARVAIRYTALGAALLTPYFLLLVVIPTPLLRFFYGTSSPYLHYGQFLRFFVTNYTIIYLQAAISAWLAGLGRSRYLFYAQLLNVIVTLLVGLPCVIVWGVAGLMGGGLASAGASTLLSAYFIYRLAHQPHAHSHSGGNI